MAYNINLSVKQKEPIITNYEFCQNDYGQQLIIKADDYDITNSTAKLILSKADGNVIERTLTQSNGVYTYTLDAQDLSCPGKVVTDVKYYKPNERSSSARFIFNVYKDNTGTLVTSTTYSDALQQALANCQQAIADVESAILAELNIYNNYDKTSAGYAADARQLNENVAGSYAEMIKNKIGTLSSLTTTAQGNLVAAINELKSKNDTQDNSITTNTNAINTLNNNLGYTPPVTVNTSALITNNIVYYKKNGNVCITLFGGNVVNALSAWGTLLLFTLPEGYRPPTTLYIPCIYDSNLNALILQVEANGKVSICNRTNGTISYGNSFMITGSYPV